MRQNTQKFFKKLRRLLFLKYRSVSCSVMSDSLQSHGLQSTRLLCPWNSPGKNTGVGCHSLLHRIFPTQGSNPGLLHCKRILYCLSHKKYNNFYILNIHIYICTGIYIILSIIIDKCSISNQEKRQFINKNCVGSNTPFEKMQQK